jgi:hypothetical protein
MLGFEAQSNYDFYLDIRLPDRVCSEEITDRLGWKIHSNHYKVTVMFLSSRQLLDIIGRSNPAIYDAIFPRGGVLRQGSEVTLNPKPLPPHELGAAIATEFIHTIWVADRFGLDVSPIFIDLEDWCPTGKPKFPKLPPWWPPVPEPEPQPDWFVDFHLGFAARIALVSSDFQGTQLGEYFEKTIDRSISTVESSLATMRDGTIG